MGRSNKKKMKLTFYQAPHIVGKAIVKHRYTMFSKNNSGKLLQTTSFLQSNVLPESQPTVPEIEVGEHEPWFPDGFETPQNTSVDHDTAVDQEYLAYLQQQGEDGPVNVLKNGDYAFHDFIPNIDLFLQEIIGLDGRGPWADGDCAGCHKPGSGEFRCLECVGRAMLCLDCILAEHKQLYLHRIEKWNGTWFEKTSLKVLGLHVQLGHPLGDKCFFPLPASNNDFVVVHSNGIHEIGLSFCGCGKGDHRHAVQLLRYGLFSATITQPKSVATIEVLDLFAMLSYQSKMSAFQFYHTLSRMTDNSGVCTPKDRYPAFLRMAREWRHLLMLKRAGRGHAPGGAAATKEGECGIICPACPQPGKNMEVDDWKGGSPNDKYLDTLFISIDANFRLKQKNISSDQADPGLSHGYSYFVEESKYKEHLKNHVTETEPKSNCSRHDAVNKASKPGKGYAATGVGAVVCSRHDMKLPLGVAQLQRGERYCNMDYIFRSSLASSSNLHTFVLSYDIACQWSINLQKRMEDFSHTHGTDPFFLFDSDKDVRFVVPKFHLPAHIAACRIRYSLNLLNKVGRTNAESPERGWEGPNDLAPSTFEMGPGSCRDTLDAHFGDANHRKVTGMAVYLERKLDDAARQMAEHTIAHRELEHTIDSSTVEEWTVLIENWEADPSQPNPFQIVASGPSQAAVRRQLAEEEKKQLEDGRDMSLNDNVSPSVLISTGINLENEQRLYKEQCSQIWEHALDRQHTKLILRGNTLIRKIETWARYQELYMPNVSKLRNSETQKIDHTTEVKAYDVSLWLPSKLHSQVNIPQHFRRLEFDLRIPQASEALDNIRSQLQLRAHLFNFKNRFSRGQAANTRSQATLSAIQTKITRYVLEYRSAYAALCVLGEILGETTWRDEYLPLADEDIRDLSEGKPGQSEGRQTISWLWRTTSLYRIDEPHLQQGHYREGVKIEWAKSRARAHRFTEEVALLRREMQRVKAFFVFKSQEWGERAIFIPSDMSTPMLAEGLFAYAHKQRAFYKSLEGHCTALWKDVPSHISRMEAIIDDPDIALPDELSGKRRRGEHRRRPV